LKKLLFSLFLFSSVYSWAQTRVISGALNATNKTDAILDKANAWCDTIDALVATVQNSKAYKTIVDGTAVFPYAVLPKNGNENYALYIKDVNLDPVLGLKATICMKVPFRSNQHLYFMADQIPVSQSGQVTGDFKLQLVKSVNVKFGDGYVLSFIGGGSGDYDSTYVTFDCHGFKNVTVNGTLQFDKNSIRKVEGDTISSSPFVLPFYLQANSLEELVIDFHNVPEFEFKKLSGFRCKAERIVLDNSEERNAPSFQLPLNYMNMLSGRMENFDADVYGSDLWKGVYIPQVEITIPRGLNGDAVPATIVGENFIVDENGITAHTFASTAISGSIRKFDFSIDSLKLTVAANKLQEAGFWGDMRFPISDEQSSARYGMNITIEENDNLKYSGYVESDSDKALIAESFGGASMHLNSCKLDFLVSKKKFYPEVVMSGGLDFAPKSKNGGSAAVGSFGLTFREFMVSSRKPFLDILENGYFGWDSNKDASMSKLPISIDSISLKKESDNVAELYMAVSVHLQSSSGGQSGNAFCGSTAFSIFTKRDEVSNKWKYNDFKLNKVAVTIDNSSFSLNGSLERFENDYTYGTGFCGNLDLSLLNNKINVEVAGMFGEKSGLKYWFADATIGIPPVQLAPGVELFSFSGGIYYQMEMKQGSKTSGTCASDLQRYYIPNKDIFLGVLAGISIRGPGGAGYNGNINLGLEFNSHGGLNRIATWGKVDFLTTPAVLDGAAERATKAMSSKPLSENTESQQQNSAPQLTAPVVANWYVQFDFENDVFSGDFNVYIDVANGLVTGIDSGTKRAGNISMYADKNDWYVYIGRPALDKMLGINIANVAQIGGYMCMGSVLPNPPIAEIPGDIRKPDALDEGLIAMGGGVSFGGRFYAEASPGINLGLCDIKVKLVTNIEAGFDVLLTKTKQPVICGNTGDERGFRNWYAVGQAYISGGADLKVKYDCWLGRKNFSLMKTNVLAYIYGQLPNPTYIAGSVSLKFSILRWDFKKSFPFKFGDKCEMATRSDNDIKFIHYISPAQGSKEVSVTEKIQVSLSNSLEDFTYTIRNSTGENEVYRKVLVSNNGNPVGAGLIVECNNTPIDFDWELNETKDHIVISPKKVLPEESEITVRVFLKTERQMANQWLDAESVEDAVCVFTTGKESAYFLTSNVEYAYPLPNMTNFYVNESNKGVIQLNISPRKAVQKADNYSYQVSISEYNNEVARVKDVVFDNDSKFTFNIPTGKLDPQKTYTFRLLKAPIEGIDSQLTQDSINAISGAVVEKLPDTVLLSYSFTTSQYTTFADKISMYNTTVSEVFNGVATFQLSINKMKSIGVDVEPISDYECVGYYNNGIQTADQLIQFGDASYKNDLYQVAKDASTSIGNVSDASGVISGATDIIAKANEALTQMNLDCLINGGCSSSDFKRVTIPAGKMILPISYYVPGQETPTSTSTLSIDVANNIILPKG